MTRGECVPANPPLTAFAAPFAKGGKDSSPTLTKGVAAQRRGDLRLLDF